MLPESQGVLAEPNTVHLVTAELQDGTVKPDKGPAILPWFQLPGTQSAVVTPIVGKELNLHLQKVLIREPKAGEVVVRVAWTGICGSVRSPQSNNELVTDQCQFDLLKDATFSVGPRKGFPGYNHIAGHEGIGHVVCSHDPTQLGRAVATRYFGGECKSCPECLHGVAECCQTCIQVPMHFNGTFLELLPDFVFRGGPKSPSPSAYTAALCSGSAALKAVQAANIQNSDVIVVIGVGGSIGHLCGLIAGQVFGAKVIGVDLASKLDAVLAHEMTICDETIAAPETDDPISLQVFKEALAVAATRLRRSPYDTRLPDALINAANTGMGFVGCENYVHDGGIIVWTG